LAGARATTKTAYRAGSDFLAALALSRLG